MIERHNIARPIFTVDGKRWTVSDFLSEIPVEKLKQIQQSLEDVLEPISLARDAHAGVPCHGAILYTGGTQPQVIEKTSRLFSCQSDAVLAMYRALIRIKKEYYRSTNPRSAAPQPSHA